MKKVFLTAVLALAMLAGVSSAEFAYIDPNGNGAYSEWMNYGCSMFSEYQCVDDGVIWPDLSNYLHSNSAGKRETFAFDNIGGCHKVMYVRLNYFAKTCDYNCSHAEMQPLIRASGVDYAGMPLDLSSEYHWYSLYYYTNPATGFVWTCADVNNLEAGMKTVDGGQVATVYALVSYD